MRTIVTFAAVAALSATGALAADGDFIASSSATAFSLNTTVSSVISVSSQSDIDSLMSVGWSKGESATLSASDGVTSHVLASVATQSGQASIASCLLSGGVWRLWNPAYGTVRVGVPWSVFSGEDVTIDTSSTQVFCVDTKSEGPNRRGSYLKFWPGIAYSGDLWAGSVSAVSTLTVVPPEGAPEVTNLTGCGALAFLPQEIGVYTLTLVSEAGTLTSEVRTSGGMSLIFR